MLGHSISLNKFKKVEIISSIFSNHNDVNLEINNRKKAGKFTNTWRLNNTLMNNQWVKEGIEREMKKISLDKQKRNYNASKLTGCRKSSSGRVVYGTKCLR